jgi:hypothetical protein
LDVHITSTICLRSRVLILIKLYQVLLGLTDLLHL